MIVTVIPKKPWRWFPFRFFLPAKVFVTGINRNGRMLKPMKMKLETQYSISLRDVVLTNKSNRFFVFLAKIGKIGGGTSISKGVRK